MEVFTQIYTLYLESWHSLLKTCFDVDLKTQGASVCNFYNIAMCPSRPEF